MPKQNCLALSVNMFKICAIKAYIVTYHNLCDAPECILYIFHDYFEAILYNGPFRYAGSITLIICRGKGTFVRIPISDKLGEFGGISK